MIYLIDSSPYTASRKIQDAKKFFDKYNIEYTHITTIKSRKDNSATFHSELPRDMVEKMCKLCDYNIKEMCKGANSQYTRTMIPRWPQAVRDYQSGRVWDLPLSKFVTWLAKHPCFLKITCIYDDVRGIILFNFKEEELRTFIPKNLRRSKQREVQYTVLADLGIASTVEADQPGAWWGRTPTDKKLPSSI